MLFTNDPKMAKEQKKTGRDKRTRTEFDEALEKYNIKEARIIYLKGKKNYFAEAPEVYEQFLKHYDIPKK